MLLLSKSMIQQCFTMRDGIDTVREAFQLSASGKVQAPLRTHMLTQDNAGTFLCMPAYCAEQHAACVKVLSVFPGNLQKGLSTILAQVLVMNTETGMIEGLLDGNTITQLRTGAASGVALESLAKKECTKGALIGCGAQGVTQLEAMLLARPMLQEVQVSDLSFDAAKAFAAQMQQALPSCTAKITAVQSGNDAVTHADIIIAATSSTRPVFDGERVKNGATICGVGSYQPQMQELPALLLTRATKIFFDSQAAVLEESGDILIPLKTGDLTPDKFKGDIGHVLSGAQPGRENEDEIIVFKTVGIAAQDVITAKNILEKARAAGIGLQWNA